MKIYISADIEGIVGVLDGSECTSGNIEYEKARRLMTMEVESAAKAAIASGAKEVFVKDAHGNGRNIILDNLPEEVTIIRGWSGHPFKMMQELDSSFDGVIMLGYHAGANEYGNNLAHTINGGIVRQIRINGESASEFIINTYTAASVGVPVIFVSGDQELIEEDVKEMNIGIETLSTKIGKGGSTISMSPKRVEKLTALGVKEAIRNLGIIGTTELPKEFKLEIDFSKNQFSELASHYPNMRRVKNNTVEGTFNSYIEVLKAIIFTVRS